MKKLCLAFIFICFPSIGTVNDEDFVYNDYHEIIHDVAELTWGGYQENALTVFDDNDYDCNTNVADDDPSMDNDNRNWDVNANAIKDNGRIRTVLMRKIMKIVMIMILIMLK